MMGPNVRKLVALKISVLSVPDGGGIEAALAVLGSNERIAEVAREAQEWVAAAIAAVKAAPGGTWNDDETIAGEILRRFEERRLSSMIVNRTPAGSRTHVYKSLDQ